MTEKMEKIEGYKHIKEIDEYDNNDEWNINRCLSKFVAEMKKKRE